MLKKEKLGMLTTLLNDMTSVVDLNKYFWI